MRIFPGDRIDLLGNSSIGIFGMATDSYALVPQNTKPQVKEKAAEILNVPIVGGTLVNSHLLGIFAVGNSRTLLIPELTTNDEYEHLRHSLPENIELTIIDSKISALGNTIILTDKVALISDEFTSLEGKFIEDETDVEVIRTSLMGNHVIGSLIFQTQNGFLAHPNISEEELDWLSDKLRVEGNYTTVNRGTPYPRPGIIGNSSGVLVGSDTTGPEMMRIYQVLSPN